MGDAHSATHTIRVGDSSVYKKKKRRRRRMRMRMRMREIVEREEIREGGWMEEGGGELITNRRSGKSLSVSSNRLGYSRVHTPSLPPFLATSR